MAGLVDCRGLEGDADPGVFGAWCLDGDESKLVRSLVLCLRVSALQRRGSEEAGIQFGIISRYQ